MGDCCAGTLAQKLKRSGAARFRDLTIAHALSKSRVAMLVGIPLIHIVEQLIVLVDDQRGPFGQNIEIGIGHHGGYFNNALGLDQDRSFLNRSK